MKRAAVLGVVVLGTLAALLLGGGSAVVALAPLLAFLALWAMWKLPLRFTMIALTFIALAVDSPIERPHAGWWAPRWAVLGELFFNNLYHLIPLPFLRFSLIEFLAVYLTGVVMVRHLVRRKADPAAPRTPAPLAWALGLSFCTVLALWIYGLAQGEADLTQSIWQMRVSLMMPVFVMLYAAALRGPEDQRNLGKVIIAAAIVKVVEGSYFYFVLCRPIGQVPPYVTTHTDSVLFAVAILICIVNWWERPTRRNLAFAALVIPVVMLGVVINDRRLAYVNLGMMFLAVLLVSPWNRAKKLLVRAAVVGFPLIAAYVSVGWHSDSGLFKPVRVLRSVTASDTGTAQDSSTEFRNLENFNLVKTIEPNLLIGQGFGHPYNEVIKLPDISKAMPHYRYLPHNTVLWLISIGGFVGFTAMWLYLIIGVFFATRAYHFAVSPTERAAMLVSLCTVIAFLNQAFGDMGVQAYGCVFTVAPSIALAGTVATRVGAWNEQPARPRPRFRARPAAPTVPAEVPS